jgi:putative ATPase
LERQDFYRPSDRGFEARVRERREYWAERRKALQSDER